MVIHIGRHHRSSLVDDLREIPTIVKSHCDKQLKARKWHYLRDFQKKRRFSTGFSYKPENHWDLLWKKSNEFDNFQIVIMQKLCKNTKTFSAI